MIGRRLTYGATLIVAIALHLAYGQYVTFYMLLFLLLLPGLSLLLSLPAILTSSAELKGGADIRRGRSAGVEICLKCRFFLPPELWKLKIEQQNLFVDAKSVRSKQRFFAVREKTIPLDTDADRLGTRRFRICSARVCDYLGLFSIPIRKSETVTMTVLPNAEAPDPIPAFIEPSERILKAKPQGFSEEHELRPYREGDAVNLIHWKLTEKMDATIVREPQEVIRKNVVLCMDCFSDYACEQSVMEQLQYLADVLNENGIPFLLVYGFEREQIDGDSEYTHFLRAFLSGPVRDEQAQKVAPGNDTVVYRIVPKKGVRS